MRWAVRRWIPLLLLSVLPGTALAGPGRFEITPFAAYRFGGEIEARDNALFDTDVDVDEGGAVGAVVGIPVGSRVHVELLYSRQETEFVEDRDLFGGTVGLLDVDVTYYHVGASWQWNLDRVHPFLAAGLGVGRIEPEGPADDDDRFSASFGGGVKLMVGRHVGFRFEARSFWTNTDGDDDELWDGFDDLVQGEVKAGLVLAF